MKIGSIVVRCYEFDRMLAFWQEALGYEPREPARGGWVVLRDPEGRGPNVSLDRVPKPWFVYAVGSDARASRQDQQGAPGPLHD